MPNFSGWSKRELLAYQSLSGLSLEIAGQGYGLTQSVEEGQLVKENEPVVIELHPPEIYYPARAEAEAKEELQETVNPEVEELEVDSTSETQTDETTD